MALDHVDPTNMYLIRPDTGGCWRSTNSGATWSQRHATLPGAVGVGAQLTAVPGKAGHLFYAGGTGNASLKRSVDSGLNWVAVSNVTQAWQVSAGATKPGGSYPSVFITGIIQGSTDPGVFRADDFTDAIANPTWVRLSRAPGGNMDVSNKLFADLNTYGTFYLTMGTGYMFGELDAAPVALQLSPPPIASAAGFLKPRVLNNELSSLATIDMANAGTAGFDWYRRLAWPAVSTIPSGVTHWASFAPNAAGNFNIVNGKLSITGTDPTSNLAMVSACYSATDPRGYAGHMFGPGFYTECEMSWVGPLGYGSVAFWAMPRSFLTGTAGTAAGTTITELDFMENGDLGGSGLATPTHSGMIHWHTDTGVGDNGPLGQNQEILGAAPFISGPSAGKRRHKMVALPMLVSIRMMYFNTA